MKKIRAVLLGCGVVGQDVIRNSAKRGVEYIGIFDVNPHIVGTKWEGIPVMDVSELESIVSTIVEVAGTVSTTVTNTVNTKAQTG
mgnify:CR=1 FL=1